MGSLSRGIKDWIHLSSTGGPFRFGLQSTAPQPLAQWKNRVLFTSYPFNIQVTVPWTLLMWPANCWRWRMQLSHQAGTQEIRDQLLALLQTSLNPSAPQIPILTMASVQLCFSQTLLYLLILQPLCAYVQLCSEVSIWIIAGTVIEFNNRPPTIPLFSFCIALLLNLSKLETINAKSIMNKQMTHVKKK